jgi:L-2,4-diaminobutyrate decarboxylase
MWSDAATRLTSGARPEEVARDLAPLLDFQPKGMALETVLEMVRTRLEPHLMRYDHPGFQSMFNAVPEAAAQAGGQLAVAYNQGVTNWQVSPGGAILEELCARALCRLFGLGPDADATFMYSGTYANQQALYLGLHRFAERRGHDLARDGLAGLAQVRRLRVFASREAHFSLRHAVRMLGLGEQSITPLALDGHRRIDLSAARVAVGEAARVDEVVCVVATAGTTPTGAVDSIAGLADICAEYDAWLHVDGAYGFAYKLVPEWAPLFEGDRLADSITWDPHKQMGLPIPNSVLFVRTRQDFARMALTSSYFNRSADTMPNPGLKSPPSTRPLAALPLVVALRAQGLDTVVNRLRAPLVVMRDLAQMLTTRPGIELRNWPDTGVVCFRVTPPGVFAEDLDALQRRLFDSVMASGTRTISTTVLDGEAVLRLVCVNPDTRLEDLLATVELLEHAAEEMVQA